jgi:hypothetical protein
MDMLQSPIDVELILSKNKTKRTYVDLLILHHMNTQHICAFDYFGFNP